MHTGLEKTQDITEPANKGNQWRFEEVSATSSVNAALQNYEEQEDPRKQVDTKRLKKKKNPSVKELKTKFCDTADKKNSK